MEASQIKRLLARLAGTLALFAVMLYAGDYLWARYRASKQDAFDAVAVTPLYVIHEKNGKVEYQFAQPENETCVRSLFPHFGFNPCWYVRRHTERRIEM